MAPHCQQDQGQVSLSGQHRRVQPYMPHPHPSAHAPYQEPLASPHTGPRAFACAVPLTILKHSAFRGSGDEISAPGHRLLGLSPNPGTYKVGELRQTLQLLSIWRDEFSSLRNDLHLS